MPKRTNDFQALIALVERRLAASGVRVVESEMLVDRPTGERREVDVCVYATVSGKDVTLVEARASATDQGLLTRLAAGC